MREPPSWTLAVWMGLAVGVAGLGSRVGVGPRWPLWDDVELGVLAIMAAVDATDRMLAHRLIAVAADWGLALHLWTHSLTPGLFLRALAFFVVGLGLVWVTQDGFGFGDVKWLTGFALVVGWRWGLAAAVSGLWLAGAWVVGRRLGPRRHASTRYVPLAPFFALGGWLALIGYAVHIMKELVAVSVMVQNGAAFGVMVIVCVKMIHRFNPILGNPAAI